MKRTMQLLLALAFSSNIVWAQAAREFPEHWGPPPAIQTRDLVELPGGYGRGSSTLAKWIAANLEKDKDSTSAPPASRRPIYANDFERAEAGRVPDEFMVLAGDFSVQSDGTNSWLELPGAPLDSFGVLFGPTEKADVAVQARVFGTAKGRRAPTFGVGLGGVSGWKLQVSPGKKAVELLKDQEVRASRAFEWKSGEWMRLRLQLRASGAGEWRVEGRVWPQVEPEPREWALVFDEKEEPVPGRASVLGSPFSGTPIRFDDLKVERVEK